MNVEIDGKAIKDLSRLHKGEVTKILSKIEELEKYPHIPNLKKLTNFEPPYRLTVYRVRHRKESYK